MADWPLPPYVEPRGPAGDDESVVRAFARAELAPHSDRLHVEGAALLATRDVPAALRVGRDSVLVRVDLPEDLLGVKSMIQQVLADEGMTLLDGETMLGIPVALQMVGLRLSSWDLWGRDIEVAFGDLREAAMGGRDDQLLGGGEPPPPFA